MEWCIKATIRRSICCKMSCIAQSVSILRIKVGVIVSDSWNVKIINESKIILTSFHAHALYILCV